jgi:hypothetical protein
MSWEVDLMMDQSTVIQPGAASFEEAVESLGQRAKLPRFQGRRERQPFMLRLASAFLHAETRPLRRKVMSAENARMAKPDTACDGVGTY